MLRHVHFLSDFLILLCQYLLNYDNFPALYELARAVPNLERLAENLLRIYDSYDATLSWICAAIDYEVSAMGFGMLLGLSRFTIDIRVRLRIRKSYSKANNSP